MAYHFWFLLLLLAPSTISVSGSVFVSIDCGASGAYTDENSIAWKGDSDLFPNGITQVVQSNNSISRVMDTLRVFTSRRKNCYPVKAEKGRKVLVRASFNYGNYDNKSSPPMFDLLLDGNLWANVNLTSSGVGTYEVTYVAKRDVVGVCLAQTEPGQFPFISALEVRGLDSQMYGHMDVNRALFLILRSAYATNETIRFPADPYDRMWTPATIGDGLLNATNDASLIKVDVPDNPPQTVFKHATRTENRSYTMNLGLGITDENTRTPFYINWYFSEVDVLNSTESRSFRIYSNNKPFSLPIVPPYGNVIEYYVSNLTLTPNTNFSLVPTGDSTLPPLINAAEVFSVSDALTEGTNSSDVDGLVSLQNAFVVLQEWGGDPCLPAPYSWEWLNCSSDTIPRVTSLDLHSFGLSGSFPNISSMDALETIDLHNNSLNGSIPDFLGNLPNLKQLNLADNQFSGRIPISISKNSKLNLIVTGNPSLCTSGKACAFSSSGGSGGKKKNSKLPVILGTTIPLFFIFCTILGAFVVLRKRSKASMAAGTGMATGANGTTSNPRGTDQSRKTDEEATDEIKVNPERFYGSPSPLLVNNSD